MAMIRENILRLRDDISLICRQLGRDPEDITLVVVTKHASQEDIKEAIALGVSHIGENKVQEALKKFSGLPEKCHIARHMIGHLQSNKVKDAVQIFEYIQSVDSAKLAAAIDKEAGRLKKTVDIFVQVNTSGEAQKFGVSKDGALALLADIAQLKHLNVLGLMTIGPLTEDEAAVRNCFKELRLLRDRIGREFAGAGNIQMKFLSMGMSSDYKIALEEGSNMVRIGSRIFRHV